MTLRIIFFWLHLCSGVVAGVVILIMSATGVLLTYEKQMLVWSNRGFYAGPPSPGAGRVPIETVLHKIREEKGALPVSITLRADPAAPLEANLGPSATILVNPYTGRLLGGEASGMRAFFRVVTDWHRWLGRDGERRALGRAITGAANLIFLFIVLSGLYMWWPQQWRWQKVKAVTLFRPGLRGKALDFNWHNVFGFWSAIPLAIVVASAVVISYPWASNLVYRAVGEDPPARRAPPGGGGPGGRAAPTAAELNPEGFERLLQTAVSREDGWKTVSFRLPRNDAELVTFTIDRGSGGQPHLRSQLTLDRYTGETVSWEPFEAQSRGRKLRSLLRFAHTGEAAGLAGQTVAGLVSLATCFLVWTGIALTWRRFRAWRKRRKQKPPPAARAEVEVTTLTAP